MELLLVLAVVAAAVWLVAGPLRPGWKPEREQQDAARIAELEAMKEAKYREIRDAELDVRTGKLSRADWRELDRALRAEAIAILEQLDDLQGVGEEERNPPTQDGSAR